MSGVKTSDIYKGVFPFIVIQFVMILVVIAFPQLVMVYKSGDVVVDPSKVNITVPMSTPGGAPGMTLPPLGGAGGNGGLPGLRCRPSAARRRRARVPATMKAATRWVCLR